MESFRADKNKIAIDADGWPVVKLAAGIAKECSVCCTVVCDSAHVFEKERLFGSEVVVVSQGADSVDFYIVNNIRRGDIVVTQDYGLAAMCLAKKATVVNQNGQIYSDDNISGLLESRALGKKIRRSGGRLKGPSKRTVEQDEKFERTLRRLLKNAEV